MGCFIMRHEALMREMREVIVVVRQWRWRAQPEAHVLPLPEMTT